VERAGPGKEWEVGQMALRQMTVKALKLLPVAAGLLLVGAVVFNVSAVSK
jgi:hypothetical protein